MTAALAGCAIAGWVAFVSTQAPADATQFNDSHFHLTNYVQEGISVPQFLSIMGNRVSRSTLFGIPLQQQWSFANSGEYAPTYYLQTDAPLYYYSFTDAFIASAYRGLPKDQQARFDPVTGFNPADMYAVDHPAGAQDVSRRFTGSASSRFWGIRLVEIWETAKASRTRSDRILDFAAEAESSASSTARRPRHAVQQDGRRPRAISTQMKARVHVTAS
jgi:hypothetical protein